MHPALQRSWLQTGGQPVQPVHHIFRQAFDQVHRVEWLGMGCAKLYDATGVQVGILQLQGPPQVELDHAVEAVLLKECAGEDATPAPNPAAGDTVIRALDMSDPADRELVRLGGAITGVADRPDLPPVDLPDFARNLHEAMDRMDIRPAAEVRKARLVGLAAAVLLIVAAVVAVVLLTR